DGAAQEGDGVGELVERQRASQARLCGVVDIDEVRQRGRCDVKGLFEVVEVFGEFSGNRGEPIGGGAQGIAVFGEEAFDVAHCGVEVVKGLAYFVRVVGNQATDLSKVL